MPKLESKVKFPALFLEGGDSVGKNELVRTIAKQVLLADPSKKVLLMNFPQFWFFGHDIRLVIRGACDEMLSKVEGVENAFIRSSLYGMDRDLALLLAEPYLMADPSIFVLSDRGPYSSCVTTGYLWANGIVNEQQVKEEIVPQAFETADAGMLGYFDATSLLCYVEGGFEKTGLGKRKALDKYETELPQMHAYQVYRMLGLPEIATKQNEVWRSREELAREALTIAGYKEYADAKITEEELLDDTILLKAYSEKRLILIGPELFLKHFHAQHLIDERLRGMLQRWNELSLTNYQDVKKNRKEILDDLETKIALTLKRQTKRLDYLGTRRSPQAKAAIAKLLAKYPIIYDLMKKTSGKRMEVFFQGILAPEQLHFDA